MTVLHLVAHSAYPARGGMQESVLRIASGLAAEGLEVVVYALSETAEQADAERREGVRVVPLGDRVQLLLEPYAGADSEALLEAETTRAQLMTLEHATAQEIAARPDARNLLLSFYASGPGFLAQHVACRLGLPHIASFRGTDFARDLTSVRGGSRVRFVAERADAVATTNGEQGRALAATFALRRPPRTIYNAVAGVQRPLWTQPPLDGGVRLFSDVGLSGRKGTHLLIRAVIALADKGLPVSLTIVGGVFSHDSPAYWERLQAEALERHPGRFEFPGHVQREEIDERLRTAHLYCSATPSEGCSLSRIRALTLGVPIVTTRSGALSEVVVGADHVRLCPPGDVEALSAAIEAAVGDLLDGRSAPDPEIVGEWRSLFSPDRERREWREIIEAVLAEERSGE